VYSAERYLILSLEASDLQKLQSFIENGDLELTQLTSIWDGMLQQAENPEIPKWYNPISWMPRFQISNEASSVQCQP
jgi:hypothetical protein